MPPASFREVLRLWPSLRAARQDIGSLAPGGELAQVYSWHARDKIPEPWFDRVLEAAQRRGFDEVTYRLLSDIARGRAAPPAQAQL